MRMEITRENIAIGGGREREALQQNMAERRGRERLDMSAHPNPLEGASSI